MKVFLITTRGLCAYGKAIILEESKELAAQTFQNSLGSESTESENEILDVKEIDINIPQVIYYDDGDR